MRLFDYDAPAELFHPVRFGNKSPLVFHRFETSAEAIKFAMEELTTAKFQGAVLEVGETRLNAEHISELYYSDTFPLIRRGAASL